MTEPTLAAGGDARSPRAGFFWMLAEMLAAVAVLAATWVVAGVIGLAGATAGRTGGESGPAIFPFLVHPVALVTIAVAERRRLRDWFRPRRRDLLMGAASGGLLVVLGALYATGARALGVDIPDVATELRALAPVPILLFWGAGIVPLVEEAWFRGRLVEGIDPRLGGAWTAGITGLLFAIVHGIPALFPAYFAFSLILLAVRRRTGGLVAPFVAHAVNNLVGLAPWGA